MSTVKEVNPAALKVAREYARRAHAVVPGAVIRLFGSAARGDMEELSDIDIYVELPNEIDVNTVTAQLGEIAWEVGFEHDRIIQEVIYRKSEVWDSPLRSSPFIKAVMREGVPL